MSQSLHGQKREGHTCPWCTVTPWVASVAKHLPSIGGCISWAWKCYGYYLSHYYFYIRHGPVYINGGLCYYPLLVSYYPLIVSYYPLIVRNDPLPNECDTQSSVLVVTRTGVWVPKICTIRGSCQMPCTHSRGGSRLFVKGGGGGGGLSLHA